MLKMGCNRLNHGPRRYQVPIPGTCKCHLTQKKVPADVTKLRILRWGDSSVLSKQALNKATGILIREMQRETGHRKRKRGQCSHGGRDWSDAATCQGMQAATRSWRTWDRLSLEPQGGEQPCSHPDFSPVITYFELLASRIVRK